MSKDIITIYDDNGPKEYKLLMIIDQEYKYIIYTDLDNLDIKKDLYAIKVKELNSNEVFPITSNEWDMIKKTYNKLVNVN